MEALASAADSAMMRVVTRVLLNAVVGVETQLPEKFLEFALTAMEEIMDSNPAAVWVRSLSGLKGWQTAAVNGVRACRALAMWVNLKRVSLDFPEVPVLWEDDVHKHLPRVPLEPCLDAWSVITASLGMQTGLSRTSKTHHPLDWWADRYIDEIKSTWAYAQLLSLTGSGSSGDDEAEESIFGDGHFQVSLAVETTTQDAGQQGVEHEGLDDGQARQCHCCGSPAVGPQEPPHGG